jgi:hypothetical protein
MSEKSTSSGLRRWGAIVLAIGAFVLALFVGTRVIGALMGVVMPPEMPLPESATQVSYNTDRFGRERWVYSATSFSDSVIAFYQSAGAVCEVPPFSEERQAALRLDYEDVRDPVAFCVGDVDFDRFAMRYSAVISPAQDGTLSRLEIMRVIDWFEETP